jgi:glycosyltransferase involved in cell wall biosynthesis
MNIWIFNHYAITPDLPGGTRHYDFAKELVKRGHEVAIFASGFSYLQHKELKLASKEKFKVENVGGVNFVWIKTFPYQSNDWRRIINMVSYMNQAYWLGRKISNLNRGVSKPDIIIGSSVHLLAVLTAYQLSKYHKAEFVMEVRDLWPQTLVDMGRYKENNLIIKILRCLEVYLYARAKKIIVLLPLLQEYITSLKVKQSKIAWIPNGVDLERFKYFEQKADTSKFKVMYLGAHGEANALNTIIDAAKITQDRGYKNIKYILIGDGSKKKELIARKNKLNIETVDFCPAVEKNYVSDVLHLADSLVFHLKKTEVFKYGISSNKLFDYMMSGKPLIFAVNTEGNLIKEVKNGISIPPENPELMAEAVIKLYQMSPGEREAMGQKGSEYVKKYHNISVLVDKLEGVIKEVIGEKVGSN